MPANQDDGKPARGSSVGRIESIQISNGGVPKLRVVHPVRVRAEGLEGDRQRDLRHHGGPDRAVCLLAQEVIDALRAHGHPIDRGTTGENLTISGLSSLLEHRGFVRGWRLFPPFRQTSPRPHEDVRPGHPARLGAGGRPRDL